MKISIARKPRCHFNCDDKCHKRNKDIFSDCETDCDCGFKPKNCNHTAKSLNVKSLNCEKPHHEKPCCEKIHHEKPCCEKERDFCSDDEHLPNVLISKRDAAKSKKKLINKFFN